MKIIECPRDAMQGLAHHVPTALKVKYINQLLQVGFDTIDFGSFVSPKAVPQMADTAEVLEQLSLGSSTSKLLAIVANVRGAETACDFEEIDYLGYPLSLSETFQQRNTKRSIEDAFNDLAEIRELTESNDKSLVVYLSMGLGNPYGDHYSTEIVSQFVDRLDEMEVDVISLSDTVGVADSALITSLFSQIIPQFPHIEFGAHLHGRPEDVGQKVKAVFNAGCRRIDGALKGFGGCPMADDELIGNLATEKIISTLRDDLQFDLSINRSALNEAMEIAGEVFLH
jgi:hydroxymethylglutaryl-CoA lyase